jgi:glycosyltransferase involved in cell wall biosynthesis
MPVLVTTPDLEKQGGVAAYYAMLREHLGADVHFCRAGARTAGETALAQGIRLLRDYGRFYRTARSGPYDLIHLNPSLGRKALIRDGLSLLIAKALGRRVLVFLHGWDPVCEAAIRRRFLPLFRWVYFRADAFIVLASRFQSVLREFGYDKPVYLETTVVPDDIFLHAGPAATGRDTNDGRLNLFFLSRVEKAKGVYIAVEAFRLLKEKYPLVTLSIGGDGSELAKVREYVRSRGIRDVEFPGWLAGQAKHEAMAGADIFLFPTLWGEGCPCAILEAMACGLPVVTRPVGGVPDFFEDGAMGFLTESEEPAVFAELLEKLITNPALRRRMSTYNRHYARTHFCASTAAGRMLDIYRHLLKGR